MRNVLVIATVLLSCCVGAVAKNDTRSMSESEFAAFLDQVEGALPKWEARLRAIDAATMPNVSYEVGKRVMEQRDLGLAEVGYVRMWIIQERIGRKLSREFSIASALGSIYDFIGNIAMFLPNENSSSLDNLVPLYPEIGRFRIRLMNDVQFGIERLESVSCTTAPKSRNARMP